MRKQLSAPEPTGFGRTAAKAGRIGSLKRHYDTRVEGMEIVLQPNMVLIRTDFATLETPWMSEFLAGSAEQMLFLPRAVLVLHTEWQRERKRTFFETLGRHYARRHELDEGFFLRSLMRCLERPVKVELDQMQTPERVTVELYARDPQSVTLSLYAPNRWVLGYLRSQLASCVTSVGETELVLDVSDLKAKSRLERALNRRQLLHYTIEYRYDSRFMQRLYADYADYDWEDDEEQLQIGEMLHYYTVLECPVGASQDALRKSYKKLVKVYHPDRVHSEDVETVNRYTRKFQLLQEAYTALRIVS